MQAAFAFFDLCEGFGDLTESVGEIGGGEDAADRLPVPRRVPVVVSFASTPDLITWIVSPIDPSVKGGVVVRPFSPRSRWMTSTAALVLRPAFQ
jgi:hypothetical protein